MTITEGTGPKYVTESGKEALVATDLVTGYGDHQILHGVSIESRDGISCIFGPNGSGKSTLLKALNGLLPVWEGSIIKGEADLTDLPANKIVREGVITLPQDGGLFPTMTVRENLLLGGYVVDDDEIVQDRLGDALDAFPILDEKLDAKASSLSGGQQMMVAFGRAMVSDSDIYMLDEPSAGLAPNLVDELLDQIEILAGYGAQILLVEQNVRAALEIADYVHILAQGEKQFAGTPDELSDEDDLIEAYLGL